MFKMRDLKVWEWNHRFKTVYDGLTKAEARTRCALGKKTYVHIRESLYVQGLCTSLVCFLGRKTLTNILFHLAFLKLKPRYINNHESLFTKRGFTNFQ